MDKPQSSPHGRDAPDEELIDMLIAVSVIARRMAEKLRKQQEIRSKRMKGYKNKHYGLAGQTVRAKQKSPAGSPLPWEGLEVTVRITAEYPAFLVGVVMPHLHPGGFGISHPYCVTINKHDISIGEMIINGGTIR